jgi:hypothetical protein
MPDALKPLRRRRVDDKHPHLRDFHPCRPLSPRIVGDDCGAALSS